MLCSEAYLGLHQASMMEIFCEKDKHLQAVERFKTFVRRCRFLGNFTEFFKTILMDPYKINPLGQMSKLRK